MDRAEILVAIANAEDDQTLRHLYDTYRALPPESEAHEDRVREIYLDREIAGTSARPADSDPDWPGLSAEDRANALRLRNAKHAQDRLGKILERNRLALKRFQRDYAEAQSEGRATSRLSSKISLLEEDIQSRENRSKFLAKLVETYSERLSPEVLATITEAGTPPALQDIDTLRQRIRSLRALLEGPNDMSLRDARAAEAEIARVERRVQSILSDPVALESPDRTAVVERPTPVLHVKEGERIRLEQDLTGTPYTISSRDDRMLHLTGPDGKRRYVETDGTYPAVVRLETVPYHEMLADRFERGADGAWWVRGMVGDKEARVSNPYILSDLSGFFGGDAGQQQEEAVAASGSVESTLNDLAFQWVEARHDGDIKRMQHVEQILSMLRFDAAVPTAHVVRTDGSLDVPPVIPANLRSLTDDEVVRLYRGARDYLSIPLRDMLRVAWEAHARGLTQRVAEGEF